MAPALRSDEEFWESLAQNLDVIDRVLMHMSYYRARPVAREKAAIAAADRAWEKRSQFRGEGSFRAWLGRIGYTVGKSNIDRVDPVSLEDDPTLGGRLSTQPTAVSHVLGAEVENALNQLEDRERLVVVLFFVEGFSDREIAEILGVDDPTTLPPLRHRTLVKLRHRLGAARKEA